MVLKIPPPPPIANRDPTLNRWLLEITAILNSQGGIDPTSVVGLVATTAQVGTNTTDIGVLSGEITTLNGEVATLNSEVATNTADIATNTASIVVLAARGELLFGAGAPAAGLGKVNDWYGDTAGAAGARVWIKKAVGVWTPFPF